MRTFNEWMEEYGVSHKNPTNQLVHKICVPLIMFSVIGFFWAIPRPELFLVLPYLNWATLFATGCLFFYLSLNFLMFLGMTIQIAVMCIICELIYPTGLLFYVSSLVFVLSWIAQFWGHKVEGKKPSFIQDLAFLLIGPLWVTRYFYKAIGINI